MQKETNLRMQVRPATLTALPHCATAAPCPGTWAVDALRTVGCIHLTCALHLPGVRDALQGRRTPQSSAGERMLPRSESRE